MTARKFFSTERDADVLIVVIHERVGSLADAEVMAQSGDLVKHVHTSAVRRVVVDLGEVPYFGSIMLEALLRLWNELRTADGKLALCRVSDVGTEILQLAKFDTLWPICNSRAEALETVQN